ncbi:uncharacterized protein TRAVEDRAFT_24172 [Trametes versicolor FP-101664 SS1]|uniref:uncharacterized protein n=1 Tax=Trametes versicolor (strain FP-101664) TaxID=717944 RepID=UPI0004624507|nr:uncharacterized protein TRAVEDRAFT_24172 [Trametes versicolor FP-101664 SS1]EIW52743.1 hypothetical protein TRAVEDRAFT_24172 [Trametes versicolor FP-101664 SS1]
MSEHRLTQIMDMFLTSLQSLDDDSLQILLRWMEGLPAIPSNAIDTEPAHRAGDEQSSCYYHSPVLYPTADNFDTHANQVGLQLDHLVAKPSSGDVDWVSRPHDLPQSPSEASLYSDQTAADTPQSSFSMASDDTAVDISDNGLANGFRDKQKAVPDFDAPYAYHIEAFEGAAPVTYELPSGPPPIEGDPLAFSFRYHMGVNTYVQQQQHLPGAVASVPCGMSMPAGDCVVPLTSQLFVDVPEIAPEGATPTTSRMRASTADAEKPAKKRKQQSTEKNLSCPECGSLWARRNNLDAHISSVHRQERPFACPAPGCNRAFSRKHDLKRHFQSDHTDEGSPRRKAPKV